MNDRFGGLRDCCCQEQVRFIIVVVCCIIVIAMTVTNLAVATTKETKSLSWTNFDIDITYKCATASRGTATVSGPLHVNLGLLSWRTCLNYDAQCAAAGTYCESESDNIDGLSQCYTAGQSIIASYTFALAATVIVLVLSVLVHLRVGKVRFPRILIFAFGIIALALYIQPLAYWYSDCQNRISQTGWYTEVNTDEPLGPFNASSITPGYSIALAIVCVVFSFVFVILNIFRCFRGSYDSDVTTSGAVLSAPASSVTARTSSASQFGMQTMSPPSSPAYFPTQPD